VGTAVTAAGCASAAASGVGSQPAARGAGDHTGRSYSGRLARFSGQRIGFSYPAGWRARTRDLIVNTSVFSEIVEVSPQPMHKQCTARHRRDGGLSVSCHAPFSYLRHDSLLATWSDAGLPAWTLNRAPGKRIKVGGITGKWDLRSVAESRSTLDATKVVSVVAPIPGEGSGNFLSLDVLLRGPNTAGLVRQVRSMVRSMRWSKAAAAPARKRTVTGAG
jgi:hypothetical protein